MNTLAPTTIAGLIAVTTHHAAAHFGATYAQLPLQTQDATLGSLVWAGLLTLITIGGLFASHVLSRR